MVQELTGSCDSAVGTVSMLRVIQRDRGLIPFSRRFSGLQNAQTRRGLRLASYLKVTDGDFLDGKTASS